MPQKIFDSENIASWQRAFPHPDIRTTKDLTFS